MRSAAVEHRDRAEGAAERPSCRKCGCAPYVRVTQLKISWSSRLCSRVEPIDARAPASRRLHWAQVLAEHADQRVRDVGRLARRELGEARRVQLLGQRDLAAGVDVADQEVDLAPVAARAGAQISSGESTPSRSRPARAGAAAERCRHSLGAVGSTAPAPGAGAHHGQQICLRQLQADSRGEQGAPRAPNHELGHRVDLEPAELARQPRRAAARGDQRVRRSSRQARRAAMSPEGNFTA
jgi:hypothetical protein